MLLSEHVLSYEEWLETFNHDRNLNESEMNETDLKKLYEEYLNNYNSGE